MTPEETATIAWCTFVGKAYRNLTIEYFHLWLLAVGNGTDMDRLSKAQPLLNLFYKDSEEKKHRDRLERERRAIEEAVLRSSGKGPIPKPARSSKR